MVRFGCVNYINALPLLSKLDIECTFDRPRKLNALLRNGEIDICLSSSVEYLDGSYTLLPYFGIAAREKILSVNLYTKKPLEELDGVTIGLTEQSATSISLLKVLCHHFWKIKPTFEPLDRSKTYDAFLLIGDEALEQREITGYTTVDLAQSWFDFTGLPFLFAVLSVRPEVMKNHPEEVEKLLKNLEASLDWSEAHMETIESQAAARCSLPSKLIQDYYKTCCYRLGTAELESLHLFATLRIGIS